MGRKKAKNWCHLRNLLSLTLSAIYCRHNNKIIFSISDTRASETSCSLHPRRSHHPHNSVLAAVAFPNLPRFYHHSQKPRKRHPVEIQLGLTSCYFNASSDGKCRGKRLVWLLLQDVVLDAGSSSRCYSQKTLAYCLCQCQAVQKSNTNKLR
jgi:hypothetical protein